MNRIIIYGSKYGTTKRYAMELSERLKTEVISYKEVRDINAYDDVIYMGGLYAGGICGMAKTLKKLSVAENRRLCIITVGLADPEEERNVAHIREAMKIQLPENLYNMASVFHLRGGIDYSGLSILHKMMMRMVYKKVKDTPEEQWDAETRGMIETYNKKVDFVDTKALEPVIKWIKAK